MKGTNNTGRLFGEIELKLLKAKVLNDVVKILRQVSNKDENFLYPIINFDFNNPASFNIINNPLIEGEFMGHRYAIHANGSYPVAYVNSGSYKISGDMQDGFPVHGGCDYAGPREDSDGFWVGWNYGHIGDFDKPCSAAPDTQVPYKKGKKWTVAEVMEDIIRAILYIEENG